MDPNLENNTPFVDLKSVTSSRPDTQMQQAYGKRYGSLCRECCNCQKRIRESDDLICIAYSNETLWSPDYDACDRMFNVAFRGIRPRIRTLEEMLRPARASVALPGEDQESLF